MKNLNKLTRLQLEQITIHFKSEITQYKRKVQEYEEEYHYSQLKKLKFDNAKLKEDLEEYTKKINTIEEEKSLLQMKVIELEKAVDISRDELKEIKVNYEQDLMKKSELIRKQQKKAERQKLLQKELEEFLLTLTEELNEPLIKQRNVIPELKLDFQKKEINYELKNEQRKDLPELDYKEIDPQFPKEERSETTKLEVNFKKEEIYRNLAKERINLDNFQKEMQKKITELAFLQTNGESNRFQYQIELLGQKINEYGKMIGKTSLLIYQLEKEMDK